MERRPGARQMWERWVKISRLPGKRVLISICRRSRNSSGRRIDDDDLQLQGAKAQCIRSEVAQRAGRADEPGTRHLLQGQSLEALDQGI